MVKAYVNECQFSPRVNLVYQPTDKTTLHLGYALEHRDFSFSNALLQASSLELQRFNRGISVLDTIVTLAPLEGLFGTVTGMIHAFGLLGASELGAPTAITGGIAEALEARRLKQQGVVLLEVEVNADGRPTDVRVRGSSGFSALDQAALKAVRRWEFEPARIGGLPVSSRVEVPVRFSLAPQAQGGGAPTFCRPVSKFADGMSVFQGLSFCESGFSCYQIHNPWSHKQST